MDTLLSKRIFHFHNASGVIHDDPDGIFFGWLMERAWSLVFKCISITDTLCEDKTEQTAKLPTAGVEGGAEYLGCAEGSCQCID